MDQLTPYFDSVGQVCDTDSLADRVNAVRHYVLGRGRHDTECLPIRVSYNCHGNFKCAESPNALGELVIDNAMWHDLKDDPWLEAVDPATFDQALDHIRKNLTGKIAAFKPGL